MRDPVIDPRVGDYWYRGKYPICIVMHIVGERIDICDRTMRNKKGTWSWEIESYRNIGREEFIKVVKDGEVEEDSCIFARKEWSKLTGIDNTIKEEIKSKTVAKSGYSLSFPINGRGIATLSNEDNLTDTFVLIPYNVLESLIEESRGIIYD